MVYAIDFDGVLYKDGKLDKDVVDRVSQLRAKGNKVVLHTSRCKKSLQEALEILSGIEFDHVESGKFFADFYIDDRNMSVEEFLNMEVKNMPVRDNREYRSVPVFVTEKREEHVENYTVEGYASTFDEYVLFEADGIQYKEQIMPDAFENCDFSDCCFLKDHSGTVFARTRNKTIELSIDEHGLKVRADLSKTASSRAMYEEIDAGMYDQMSFAFIVDDDSYDQRNHKRTINHIAKLYDVSAVQQPANGFTELSVATRSRFDGFIEAEKMELLKCKQALELEKAKYAYMEV